MSYQPADINKNSFRNAFETTQKLVVDITQELKVILHIESYVAKHIDEAQLSENHTILAFSDDYFLLSESKKLPYKNPLTAHHDYIKKYANLNRCTTFADKEQNKGHMQFESQLSDAKVEIVRIIKNGFDASITLKPLEKSLFTHQSFFSFFLSNELKNDPSYTSDFLKKINHLYFWYSDLSNNLSKVSEKSHAEQTDFFFVLINAVFDESLIEYDILRSLFKSLYKNKNLLQLDKFLKKEVLLTCTNKLDRNVSLLEESYPLVSNIWSKTSENEIDIYRIDSSNIKVGYDNIGKELFSTWEVNLPLSKLWSLIEDISNTNRLTLTSGYLHLDKNGYNVFLSDDKDFVWDNIEAKYERELDGYSLLFDMDGLHINYNQSDEETGNPSLFVQSFTPEQNSLIYKLFNRTASIHLTQIEDLIKSKYL